MSDELLPYIIYHTSSKNYSAYVPYKTINENIQEIANNTYLISDYLNLVTNRSDYSPSYTYRFNNVKFEIGLVGNDLNKIYESIKNIQEKAKNILKILLRNFLLKTFL